MEKHFARQDLFFSHAIFFRRLCLAAYAGGSGYVREG